MPSMHRPGVFVFDLSMFTLYSIILICIIDIIILIYIIDIQKVTNIINFAKNVQYLPLFVSTM